MARNLPTNVTAANWREVRDAWADACDRAGFDGIAEAFREVGWAEGRGFAVDGEFCAELVGRQIMSTFNAERVLGFELRGEVAA